MQKKVNTDFHLFPILLKMMCKALLIWSLDSTQSLATCFCSGSCPAGISVSTCSGNSYTVHFFSTLFFFKTDSIWSLVNLCTNHCQVPLATFLECKESSFSPSFFLSPLPSLSLICNKSFSADHLAGHHCILLAFSINKEQTSYWSVTHGPSYRASVSAPWLQATTLCFCFSPCACGQLE